MMGERLPVITRQDVQRVIDWARESQSAEVTRLIGASGAMPGREQLGRPHDISIA